MGKKSNGIEAANSECRLPGSRCQTLSKELVMTIVGILVVIILILIVIYLFRRV
jgi:flagellar biogenesis protein FliO